MSTDDDTMMLDEACLLDVPDELLKLIVAASTGQGVAAMSCACKRLRAVAKQLQASPIMCSAMSTDNDLHVAIREATHRAMAGSWGAADFALIFVANYGLPKKYTDPGDASHAVDMLREVLGKDIPIVGCACSGIMGVGADSRPAEVDPSMAGSSSSSRRAKGGPATRGVTVLLGKVPAGCAVRAFAAAQGPAAADAAWPEFEEALSLTSSQRTQLAAELAAAAAAAATATAAPAAAGSSAAGKGDGAASPATAAAAVSLLAVAAGEATATSSAAAAGPSFHAAYGDVRAELVPQMCLLLYRNAYFVEGGELDWLKAHHPGMHVVGGASSGAGDLLFSAGAVNRLASDLPASPGLIGLLLCSASSEQAAAAAISEASAAAAAAVAAAPAGEEAAAAASLCSLRSSKPLLPVACFSAYGLAPLSGCSVFTDVSATVARSGDGGVSIFEINITAATAVPGTAIVAGAGGASALQPGSVAENETAANTSSNSAEAALPVRRSQRLQESSIAAAAAALLVEQGASGLEQLSQAWEAALEVEQPPEVFVALWRCAAGTTPGPFTGAEDEVLLLEFWQFKKAAPAAELAEPQAVQVLVHREAEGPLGLLPGGTEADPLAGITQHSVWQQRPGNKLCIQLLVNSGEGSKAVISRGLARARKELWPLGAAAAAPAAAGSGFMAGCYAAAAANARAAGARSGLMGQAVFSCTARGRELYNRDDDDDVDGDETEGHQAGLHADGEAALVDAAMQQGCPFVGVYCDGELGPPVQHGCLGWAEEGVSSISTGFTSMFAVFGFRAG